MAFKKCRMTIKKRKNLLTRADETFTKIIFKSKLKIGQRWLRLVMIKNNRIPSD